MISGDTALAQGKKGAFYNTLKEFHKYWERIDIIIPKTKQKTYSVFDNVFIHSSPNSKIKQPLFIKDKGRKLYQKYNHDVMTVHEFPPFYNGIGARILWNKIKIPYLLEIFHIPGYPKSADIKERVYKLILGLFIKYDSSKAVAIRVMNKTQVPYFLIRSGVPEDKLIYIPAVYIDLNTFKKINTEKKYDLIFVARLEKNKGISNLIKAIKIVIKTKPDIKLIIVGDGSLRKDLTDFINKNKLFRNVIFSGWIDTEQELVEKYNEAKIFINPSLNEGGPRVMLEAMACGVPVITTKVGLAVDIIKDGVNGVFTDWDPRSIAETVSKLIEDQNLQTNLSEKSREVSRKFNKEETIRNYAEKIKSFIP